MRKTLYIYFQEITGFRYNFVKNSELYAAPVYEKNSSLVGTLVHSYWLSLFFELFGEQRAKYQSPIKNTCTLEQCTHIEPLFCLSLFP